LFKFVIILLVTVHALVDAKTVTSGESRSVTGSKPIKAVKKVTNDDDQVMDNPRDCAAIYSNQKAEGSQAASGVYIIYPKEGGSYEVYCDMTTDGGGWTVIQRRGDYPKQEIFFLGWRDYKEGFGDVKRDFWLGNDRISVLTNQDVYNLRLDFEDFSGQKRFAEYSGFVVADESKKYRMDFDVFLRGDAGDSFTRQKGMKFSTKDQDNDVDSTRDCAKIFKGAWWYKDCRDSNLNGLYLRGDHPKQWAQGVNWDSFRGEYYSLKKADMKIRPTSFKSEL